MPRGTTKTPAQIDREIAKLEAQKKKLEEAQDKKRQPKISRIRQLIASVGATAEELFGGAKRGRPAKIAVSPGQPKKARKTAKTASKTVGAIKYRSGTNEWTGRGRPPKWIVDHKAAGKSIDDFVV